MIERNKINPDMRKYISYNSKTGKLYWIKTIAAIPAGRECGYLNNIYRRIKFRGVLYYAHRIAWYLYYGEEPDNDIDHINGITDDNRIDNLRAATSRENNQNRKIHRDGRLVGTTFRKKVNKWQARILIDDKRKSLGYYNTEKEAHNAYLIELGGYKNESI